jgi:Excalibur calcium-binding domain
MPGISGSLTMSYTGYVEVVGDDHYDLDRDGDGVACE